MALSRDDIDYVRGVAAAIGESMFGLDEVIRLSLSALYTDGHVLLEGNPGLGKTALVKTLCQALGLAGGRWGRIQFTPDLMPADITGTRMPDPGRPGHFAFQPGPVFRWLLLADEINRATPKTQAAMLEAMAERHVTVLGETHDLVAPVTVSFDGQPLAVRPPFMVLATQNPIDQEGTYDLPEAQADRFMMKIRMPYPSAETLTRILGKDAGRLADAEAPGTPADPRPDGAAATPPTRRGSAQPGEDEALARFERIRQAVRAIAPLPSVQMHVVNLVQASNGAVDQLQALGPGTRKRLAEWHRRYVAFGLGPRAATALLLGAKAWTGLFLSGEGDPMVTGLARVLLPVMRHRLKLDLDWEARFLEERTRTRKQDAQLGSEALHDLLLTELVLLTAPEIEGYREALEVALGGTGRLSAAA